MMETLITIAMVVAALVTASSAALKVIAERTDNKMAGTVNTFLEKYVIPALEKMSLAPKTRCKGKGD